MLRHFLPLVGVAVLVTGVIPAAARAQGKIRPSTAAARPADAQERREQPKVGEPVVPAVRRVLPEVLPPKKRRKRGTPPRRPLTLEADPADLLRLPPDRDRFVWLASPRLRSAAWLSMHIFQNPEQRFRKYEPESVYDKQDWYLFGEVGGALKLGRFELSVAVPFVGMAAANFYQKGVVDREVRKPDRADMNATLKVAFRVEDRKNVVLLTPFVALGFPTGQREQYSVPLGDRTVQHETSGPQGVSTLPGLAIGWRRGMLSAVASFGVLARVITKDEFGDVAKGTTSVSWMGAYQFGVTPFRDLALTLGLFHLHQLNHRDGGAGEDLLFVAPGLRLHPYQGLYGHLGVSIPMTNETRDRAPLMVTLEAGWEFE
ncbi:MAG: hypothetical protein ABI333_19975 [bacterium]